MTSSGEGFDVTHPELLLVGHHDVMIGLPGRRNPLIYHDVVRIARMHITALEDLPGDDSGEHDSED